MEELLFRLTTLYSEEDAQNFIAEIRVILQEFATKPNALSNQANKQPSAQDIALITYANSLEDSQTTKAPLEILAQFIEKYDISKCLNTVHILPFYPWDTDRGFSVIDYYKVKSEYGDWRHLTDMAKSVNLMFDFVANHISIENPIAQKSLIERHLPEMDPRYSMYKPYKDFIICYDEQSKPTDDQLKNLARPRPNPVLSRYTVYAKDKELKAMLGTLPKTPHISILGTGWVWTTFSRPINFDGTEATRQVDLNFANYKVLVETIKILLFYIEKGAKIIRLDAIGYIWKKLGSTSLHEPEAHLILEIITHILRKAAPGVVTIAEVNELQDKVLRYLGDDDHKEADMVYQFGHFPLALHALLTQNTKYYKEWLTTLHDFEGRQFITVLGSHDGLGLKPARSILPLAELTKLESILVTEHKALPNYAVLPGGQKIIYELCATPWNLVNKPDSTQPFETQLNKYMLVVALGLVLRGMPAFYINGLLGSRNYYPIEGLDENRTINRQVFDFNKLTHELDKDSRIMKQLLRLMKIRTTEPVFAPFGPDIKVLDSNNATLFLRIDSNLVNEYVLAAYNFSDTTQVLTLDNEQHNKKYKNICTDDLFHMPAALTLEPYSFLLLKYQQ